MLNKIPGWLQLQTEMDFPSGHLHKCFHELCIFIEFALQRLTYRCKAKYMMKETTVVAYFSTKLSDCIQVLTIY